MKLHDIIFINSYYGIELAKISYSVLSFLHYFCQRFIFSSYNIYPAVAYLTFLQFL